MGAAPVRAEGIFGSCLRHKIRDELRSCPVVDSGLHERPDQSIEQRGIFFLPIRHVITGGTPQWDRHCSPSVGTEPFGDIIEIRGYVHPATPWEREVRV